MTFSKEQVDKMRNIISTQRSLVHKICGSSVFLTEETEVLYLNLLDFLEEHIERKQYTIPLLRKAIKSEKLNDVLRVVQFFSSDFSNLFIVKYCYENENREFIDIHEDEYKNYCNEDIEPVTANGDYIEDFDPKYLTFYCLVNVD
ncbi:TPA: hypothetical protein ACGBIO_003467 [Providencia rettgeri]